MIFLFPLYDREYEGLVFYFDECQVIMHKTRKEKGISDKRYRGVLSAHNELLKLGSGHFHHS